MSNLMFPTLKGMSPSITKTPMHNTLRKAAQNGNEVRARLRAYPKYQYKLSFEYLLDNEDQSDDLHTLMGFYNRMGGSFENFLLYDSSDCKATKQVFGVGDGVTSTFRLVKNYGGFIEPVYGADIHSKIYSRGAITLDANGVVSDGFIDSGDFTDDGDFIDRDIVDTARVEVTGMVYFNTPPEEGAILSWSGTYYHRVIFDEDATDFDQIFRGLWELQTIKLLSDRG